MTFSTKYFDAKWHLRHKLFSKSWLGFGWVFFLFFSEGKKKKRLHRVTFANEQRKGPSFPHHKQRGQGGRVTEWTKQTAPAGANAPKKIQALLWAIAVPPHGPWGPSKGFFPPSLPSTRGKELPQPLPGPGEHRGAGALPGKAGVTSAGNC